MKSEFKRDLQNNYLILEVTNADAEEGYCLRMAEQNQIKGLLPLHSSRRDGKLYLHYEITSRQTLESLFERKVMSYQDILFILSEIRDALDDMRRYLLSPQKLLFAPELIYALPDRGGLQLCYYTEDDEYPITVLAEFILKKLDHKDRQAVALGYGFYQQAVKENFSLTQTLKEILSVSGEAVKQSHTGTDALFADEDQRPGKVTEAEKSYDPGTTLSKTYEDETEDEDETEKYHVVHAERRPADKKQTGVAEHLFSIAHPAVLLIGLLLTAMLELLASQRLLTLTEAGGCFFIFLSAGILINRQLTHKKNEREEEEWAGDDDEEEEYEKILNEMYSEGPKEDADEIGETQCLVPRQRQNEWVLVCMAAGAGQNPYPDIILKEDPVYIGKVKNEADVILNSVTVSRMHARLEKRDGICYVRDMNSRNGTFVNGNRLMPQDECELKEEDKIAFAEIEYRVTKKPV